MQKINLILVLLLFVSFYSCKDKKKGADNNEISNEKQLEINGFITHSLNNYLDNQDSLLILSNDIVYEFPKYKAFVYGKLAMFHYNKSNLVLANHFFVKSAEEYYKEGKLVKYAEQLANLGVVNEMSGRYPEAIKNYLKALNVFNKENKQLQILKIYNNIGVVYQQIGEADKALKYYEKSLKISISINKKEIVANRYNNIGSLYDESFKNTDSAIFYYKKAFEIYKKNNDSINLPIIENNIAYIYLLNNEIEKAKQLLDNSYKIATKTGNYKIVSQILRNKAKMYLLNNNLPNARKLTKNAIAEAQKFSNKELELENLNLLYEIETKDKKFEKANKVLEKYYKLKTKIAGIEQNIKTEGIVIKYQVAEKENKIKILELENNIKNKKILQMLLFIILLIFLLAGLYFYYRFKQKSSKLKIISMQRDISNYISQLEEIKELTSEKEKDKHIRLKEKLKSFGLTEREEDVLILISEGYKNSEIAEKLFISINTVKTHTKNIFIKLDVENRTKAAKKIEIL